MKEKESSHEGHQVEPILKLTRTQKHDAGAVAPGKTLEPLDDPALSRMSLEQLADLPMPAYTKENCNGSIRII